MTSGTSSQGLLPIFLCSGFEGAQSRYFVSFLLRTVITLKTDRNLGKPWPNGPASSRKRTQFELAYILALGGQTDSQVSSQVPWRKSQKRKKHFKADYLLFH